MSGWTDTWMDRWMGRQDMPALRQPNKDVEERGDVVKDWKKYGVKISGNTRS